MRFELPEQLQPPSSEVKIGNVYKPKGGRAGRDNWVHVIVSLIPADLCRGPGVVYLSVDTDGNIRSGSQCSTRVYEERVPIGFVEGLEDLTFPMQFFE